jgi:hypothetical protein
MSEYDAPDMSQRLLYQVTLASGRIVTRPEDFGDGDDGDDGASVEYFHPIFSEEGQVLTVEAEKSRAEAQLPAR